MNNPLVSIIIPTYNRAHLIGETLDSVLAQTYTNWECIIVDDGSTDNTDEVVGDYIKKDSRFQYHHRPDTHRSGGNGARNYGFELSKGEYVQWFDDDDVMLDNYLLYRIELFDTNTMLVMGTGFYTNSELEERRIIPVVLKNYLYKEYVLWQLQIITHSVLFRRIYLEHQKMFLDTLLRGQETEFFSRLFFKIKKSEYEILEKPLFLYRQHVNTKTFQNEIYRSDFKDSQLYIAFENLKRCYVLKDDELIKYYRRVIIDVFFRALENKDLKNAKKIVKQSQLLWSKETKYQMLFKSLGNCFIFFQRGNYKIEKYFKKKNE